MNMNFKSSRRIASALLLSVVLAGCASGPNVPSPELQQRIEAARTRSDHEGLVTYYNQEAASARAKAAEHRKMAKSYQGMVAGGRGGASMPAHCNAIVSSYEGIAAEYDGMAASHRQMAEQTKP
ncbi:MAG: hypothetical protein HYX43_20545 [Burkholderiales bacterium]|nr:hypothetical protein [Burkholderiales bacterium]